MSNPINYSYLFKYIIIGDSSVGKSNILLRYTQDQFELDYKITIGVEFAAKNITIDRDIIRIQLWDTAGQETFHSITRAYYSKCSCALIVYDISNRETFENVKSWIEDCKENSSENIYMVLIGNKMDLEDKRVVSYDEGEKFAKENNMPFIETSAKTGENIEKAIYDSAEAIYKRVKDNFYDLSDESCGIKVGIVNNIESFEYTDYQKSNNKCCN